MDGSVRTVWISYKSTKGPYTYVQIGAANTPGMSSHYLVVRGHMMGSNNTEVEDTSQESKTKH